MTCYWQVLVLKGNKVVRARRAEQCWSTCCQQICKTQWPVTFQFTSNKKQKYFFINTCPINYSSMNITLQFLIFAAEIHNFHTKYWEVFHTRFHELRSNKYISVPLTASTSDNEITQQRSCDDVISKMLQGKTTPEIRPQRIKNAVTSSKYIFC
jgi:hypothetical protein